MKPILLFLICLSFMYSLSAQQVNEDFSDYKKEVERLNRESIDCEPNIHIDPNPTILYRIKLFLYSILSALFSFGFFIYFIRKIQSKNRIIKAQREKIERLYQQDPCFKGKP